MSTAPMGAAGDSLTGAGADGLAGLEDADSDRPLDFHKWNRWPMTPVPEIVHDGDRHRDTLSPPAAYLRREKPAGLRRQLAVALRSRPPRTWFAGCGFGPLQDSGSP